MWSGQEWRRAIRVLARVLLSSSEVDDEDDAATSERSSESEDLDGEEDEEPALPIRKRQRLS